jgi:hypothetical protein
MDWIIRVYTYPSLTIVIMNNPFQTGPIAPRGHVELNCRHDEENIRTEQYLWDNNGPMKYDVPYDFPKDVKERAVYEGEIVWEIVNPSLGGQQQPFVRSNFAGMLIDKVAGGNQEEKRRRMRKKIRWVGIARTTSTYDHIGGKGDPVAIVNGLITMTNSSNERIPRGAWIMARVPGMSGSNRKPRPTAETVPVTTKTLRDVVLDENDTKDMLETETSREFFKTMLAWTNLVVSGMIAHKYGSGSEAGKAALTGTYFSTEDVQAGMERLRRLTKCTKRTAEYEFEFGGAKGEDTLGDSIPIQKTGPPDALAEAWSNSIQSNSYLMREFNRALMPISGMMMSQIASDIQGISTTDAKPGAKFDIVASPVARSLIEQFQ